jgi:hypothetical protein
MNIHFPITAEIFFILISVTLGAICLFRTEAIVAYVRRRYNSSRLVRRWPFSDVVLASWYPTCVRCAGAFCWLAALLFIYQFLLAH